MGDMYKIQVLVCLVVSTVQAAVLDPALYLSPSPPLTGEPRALTQWSGEQASTESVQTEQQSDSTEEPEEPQARTFWPQPSYGIRGIHIPLTFSLTGTYGANAAPTGIIGSSYRTGIPGVMGSSYASVSEDFGSRDWLEVAMACTGLVPGLGSMAGVEEPLGVDGEMGSGGIMVRDKK
ncbi:uncharacterized protein LOC125234508 isoform X2 [Leguminivora glycinivorella]|uniref:uncharacterized protein LOC125234508 isoform X2 n=1 Tax=Leguminivora glycinivorella TaxID=1035111 RepID=UPI00200F24EB|nr:uncharacterized protein LOC125234508 isoform X2 [Leguminivora glycinivorella]